MTGKWPARPSKLDRGTRAAYDVMHPSLSMDLNGPEWYDVELAISAKQYVCGSLKKRAINRPIGIPRRDPPFGFAERAQIIMFGWIRVDDVTALLGAAVRGPPGRHPVIIEGLDQGGLGMAIDESKG